MTTTANDNLGETSPLSTRALIFRGVLLLVIGGFVRSWVFFLMLQFQESFHILSLTFITNLSHCAVYFLLGIIARYLFWPDKRRAVVIWAALFLAFPIVSYLLNNNLTGLFLRINIHFLLLLPVVLVGYMLPQRIFRDFENQHRLRQGVYRAAVALGVVIVGLMLIGRITFYLSKGYRKVFAVEIPAPEYANDVEKTKSRKRGCCTVSFSSAPSRNREIFEFYDESFRKQGYSLVGEPSSQSTENRSPESKDGSALVRKGKKTQYINALLDEMWLDKERQTIITLFGYSMREVPADIDVDHLPAGLKSAEQMKVSVMVRPLVRWPFSSWEEDMIDNHRQRKSRISSADSAPEHIP